MSFAVHGTAELAFTDAAADGGTKVLTWRAQCPCTPRAARLTLTAGPMAGQSAEIGKHDMAASQQHGDRRIVVGVGGSPSSREALRWAIRQAVLTGSVVDAVIAWRDPASYAGYARLIADNLRRGPRREGAQRDRGQRHPSGRNGHRPAAHHGGACGPRAVRRGTWR